MDKIDCLDHGYVRLVKSSGTDLDVVRSARVSYDADWRTSDQEGDDARLINYLWRNGHTSPFESVEFTFEVMAPIFVFRQWHRHRTQRPNEISGRYTELPEVFYVPEPDMVGTQSESSKQARNVNVGMTAHAVRDRMTELQYYIDQCKASFALYKKLLTAGWPREIARIVLPLSTYSRMFTTVDLHNLLKFLSLRIHKHAQYEIRVYAEAIIQLITPVVPVTMNAWQSNGYTDLVTLEREATRQGFKLVRIEEYNRLSGSSRKP